MSTDTKLSDAEVEHCAGAYRKAIHTERARQIDLDGDDTSDARRHMQCIVAMRAALEAAQQLAALKQVEVTLCQPAPEPSPEKVVTLTEKNIDRAAEAKYCEVANPDCDPPWWDANDVLKSRIREAVKKTAEELFHGSGMRLEIVP